MMADERYLGYLVVVFGEVNYTKGPVVEIRSDSLIITVPSKLSLDSCKTYMYVLWCSLFDHWSFIVKLIQFFWELNTCIRLQSSRLIVLLRKQY